METTDSNIPPMLNELARDFIRQYCGKEFVMFCVNDPRCASINVREMRDYAFTKKRSVHD